MMIGKPNKIWLTGLCLVMVSLQSVAQRKTNGVSKKPNILFIISDDLTATAISSYENSACQTPYIDSLAAQGTRFTKAYTQFPVCGPSRASIMFGYYPNASTTFSYTSGRENVGPEKKSLSQVFKDNGYYTARVSKIYHMGIPIDIEKGTDGMDDSASWTERFNVQSAEWQLPGKAELVQNNPYNEVERRGGNVMTVVQTSGPDELLADKQAADKAIELIHQHKKDPFFLAVGLVRPHVPFVAPARYFEKYPWQQIVLPPQVLNDWDDIPAQGINYVTSLNARMSSDQEKKAIAGYYASVSFMDAQVGSMLKALDEAGVSDNTIVIFTSDHGFHLGEHRFWMKVSLKEESIRVPFIIKVPGKKPQICHSLVELLDLYPTLLDLAGLKPVQQVQGKSLLPLLSNPSLEVRDAAFSINEWYGKFGYHLRTHKWSFTQYQENGSGGYELYDMENDVKQFNNLALNPYYKEILEAFKERLVQKLKTVRSNDLHIKYN